MPAPKKDIVEEGSQAELEVLRAQLAEANQRLAEKEELSREDKLEAILAMMAEKIAAPAPATDSRLRGDAPRLMKESKRMMEPMPESDSPLPYDKVYVSRGKGFSAVYKARRAMSDVDGNVYMTPGQKADFAPFGEYRTRNPETAAWLESLDSFNREFWDAENVPGSVEDSGPMIERITGFAVDLNLPELDALEQKERAGLNRQDVMKAIKAAQRQVEIALQKQHQHAKAIA